MCPGLPGKAVLLFLSLSACAPMGVMCVYVGGGGGKSVKVACGRQGIS